MRELCEAIADINLPLHIFIQYIEDGGDVNIKFTCVGKHISFCNDSLLSVLLFSQYYDYALMLLKSDLDIEVNTVGDDGTTPLITLCAGYQRNRKSNQPIMLEIAKILLEKGLKAETVDDLGQSAIIYCKLNGYFELATFLETSTK